MKITATPKVMTNAEALRTARQGGNVFGKALYGSGEITLKLPGRDNLALLITRIQ